MTSEAVVSNYFLEFGEKMVEYDLSDEPHMFF